VASPGYGSRRENAKLTQTFFFNKARKYSGMLKREKGWDYGFFNAQR